LQLDEGEPRTSLGAAEDLAVGVEHHEEAAAGRDADSRHAAGCGQGDCAMMGDLRGS
jgi:hypothetical protein